jgi:hypothetical protein
MAKIETEIKKLSIEIPLDVHCDIKKYAASRNMSMREYITAILYDRIIWEKNDEKNR